MKLAILGAAHVHAASYARICKELEDVQVSAVYDADAATAMRVANLCGAVATQEVGECLGPDIDAVLVCSENAHHLALIEAAAKAGKHILCEKPLAVTAREAMAAVTACRSAGVQLQIAFPCRYHPTITRTQEILQRVAR